MRLHRRPGLKSMVVFMKIGYAIITRARPMALIGTLMTAYKLRASDDVQFACAVDEDDREVVDLARRLANDIPLIVDERPAPSSIGTKWNRRLKAISILARELSAVFIVPMM